MFCSDPVCDCEPVLLLDDSGGPMAAESHQGPHRKQSCCDFQHQFLPYRCGGGLGGVCHGPELSTAISGAGGLAGQWAATGGLWWDGRVNDAPAPPPTIRGCPRRYWRGSTPTGLFPMICCDIIALFYCYIIGNLLLLLVYIISW